MIGQRLGLSAVVALSLLAGGCGSVRYLKDQIAGTAQSQPVNQAIEPSASTYNAPASALRHATFQVLDEQGFNFEEDAATGTIWAEPRSPGDYRPAVEKEGDYATKLIIRIDESTVTYFAKFERKSRNQPGNQEMTFPDTENELRSKFFTALDRKILLSKAMLAESKLPAPAAPVTMAAAEPSGTDVAVAKVIEESAPAVAPQPRIADEGPMQVAEMQATLLALGYKPGLADGVMGKRTVQALKRFQKDSALPATGRLDAVSVARLRTSKLPEGSVATSADGHAPQDTRIAAVVKAGSKR